MSRVSTERQNHDTQLSERREYCTNRRWTNVEEITDTVSGSKSSRKGLDRLMALVRRGKVDIVVCFKLDRLGRSLSDLAALIGEFNAHNVALVVPSTRNRHPRSELGCPAAVEHPSFERGRSLG